MVLIGFSDTLNLTQSIGVIGTMFLTLYFSETNTISQLTRKQASWETWFQVCLDYRSKNNESELKMN
jgi:hypothetical protein